MNKMTWYILIEFKPCSTIKVISNIETFFVIRVLVQTGGVIMLYAEIYAEIMLYINEVGVTYNYFVN